MSPFSKNLRTIRQSVLFALLLFLSIQLPGCSGNLRGLLNNVLKKNESGECVSHFATLYNTGRNPVIPSATANSAANPDGESDEPERKTELTEVRFSEEEFDIGGFWQPTEPARLTAPADGEYVLRLRTNFQYQVPGQDVTRPSRIIAFTVDDQVIHRETYYNKAHRSGYYPTLESSIKLKLRAGQYAGAKTGGTTEDAGPVQALPVDINIRRVCKTN